LAQATLAQARSLEHWCAGGSGAEGLLAPPARAAAHPSLAFVASALSPSRHAGRRAVWRRPPFAFPTEPAQAGADRSRCCLLVSSCWPLGRYTSVAELALVARLQLVAEVQGE